MGQALCQPGNTGRPDQKRSAQGHRRRCRGRTSDRHLRSVCTRKGGCRPTGGVLLPAVRDPGTYWQHPPSNLATWRSFGAALFPMVSDARVRSGSNPAQAGASPRRPVAALNLTCAPHDRHFADGPHPAVSPNPQEVRSISHNGLQPSSMISHESSFFGAQVVMRGSWPCHARSSCRPPRSIMSSVSA